MSLLECQQGPSDSQFHMGRPRFKDDWHWALLVGGVSSGSLSHFFLIEWLSWVGLGRILISEDRVLSLKCSQFMNYPDMGFLEKFYLRNWYKCCNSYRTTNCNFIGCCNIVFLLLCLDIWVHLQQKQILRHAGLKFMWLFSNGITFLSLELNMT